MLGPVKSSLVTQTAAALRREIQSGVLRSWLPSERSLADQLKISRPTLRLALQQLEREQLVEPRHGVGYRIREQAVPDAVRPPPSDVVHLLSPEPFRLQSGAWIHELGNLLHKDGLELRLVHGLQFLKRNPGLALQKLYEQNPDRCWILAHSTKQIQKWFFEQKVPCVVAGYHHEEVELPGVVVNVEAVCRHAVGVFAAHRHTNIVFFQLKTDRAGDLLSEREFLNAARRLAGSGVRGRVVHHLREATDDVVQGLRRLFRENPRPTAILFGYPSAYLTAATFLPELGLRVPGDVSMISREYSGALECVVPKPTCYVFNAHGHARKVYGLIQHVLAGTKPSQSSLQTIPTYCRGASVLAVREG